MLPLASGVYCIRCLVDGRIYVGSSNSIRERWNAHLNKLRGNRHENCHLQEAFNTFGLHSFRCQVIELCDSYDLVPKEQFWMDVYRCYNRPLGYNLNPSANNGVLSIEVRNKIRTKAIGRKLSEETKRKVGAASRMRKDSPETIKRKRLMRLGKKHSDETKRKLSLLKKGKKMPEGFGLKISQIHNKRKKPVRRFEMFGRTFDVFDSLHDAARQGFDRKSIKECCDGLSRQHKGFLWRWHK